MSQGDMVIYGSGEERRESEVTWVLVIGKC